MSFFGGEQEFGLKPIEVATWGPFVLIQPDYDIISCDGRGEERVGDEWLGTASHLLSTNGIDTSLTHVCRRDYTINCNWKVQFFQDTRLLFTVLLSYSTSTLLNQYRIVLA